MSSLSPLATYNRPAESSTALFGWVPTVIVVRTVGSAPVMSSTETVLAPWLVTYAVAPSALSTTPYGLWPAATVWVTWVSRSTTVAASASWSATTSRRPFGVRAKPAGYGLIGSPAGFFVGSGIDAVS